MQKTADIYDASTVKGLIREIPNHPRFGGVTFYDVSTLFLDRDGFRMCVDELARRAEGMGIDKIAGIEARGFILAGALASRMNLGVVLIRKKGKLPHETISQDYRLEYAAGTLEMHSDAVSKGDKVYLIDDLLATGGTAAAAAKLIESRGGKVAAIGSIIELKGLNGRERLKGYNLSTLVEY